MYGSNYQICLCMLPCMVVYVCVCFHINLCISAVSPVCVCVCVTGPGSVPQRITLSVSMSLRLPPAASLLSLAAQIKELTHAPMSSLSFSLISLPHTLCLSVFLAIVTLFLCHSPSLSILTSSFLPDYISGDFDSITAEVKAFYADKVSGTQLAHTLRPTGVHTETYSYTHEQDFRQTLFESLD